MDRRRPGRRAERERGAALIEAAFITPVFLLFIFGIFEFGLLFRDSLTTNNAAYQGARSASVNGARPDGDYLLLRSVEHGLTASRLQQLDYIVVFRASGPDDTVPAACLTASQTFNPASPSDPACNRYTAYDLFRELDDPVTGADTGNFRCGTSAVDRFWCPSDRETNLGVGTDYVGIHIQTRHDFITGMFGADFTLTETAIVRLEPESF